MRCVLVLVALFSTRWEPAQSRSKPAQSRPKPTVLSVCKTGWTKYQDACYQLQKAPTTFNNAESICKAFGGNTHSVSIQSEGENQFVGHLQGNHNIWTGGCRSPGGSRPWTGLWRWTDGSKWIYESWQGRREAGGKEPNNNYYHAEYYVWKAPSGNCAGGCLGSWNDGLQTKPGDSSTPYPLCKYKHHKPTMLNKCKPGWSRFQGSCYKIQPSSSHGGSGIYGTFDAAEESCNKLEKGTHSVSIHSHAENRFVTRLQRKQKVKYIWTGGYRNPMRGGTKPWAGLWQWNDGSNWNFTPKWNAKELNNAFYRAEYWVWKGPGTEDWADSLNGFYPTRTQKIHAMCKYTLAD